MPSESERPSFDESIARARVAILALAPDETPQIEGAVPAPELSENATSALASLLATLETDDDTLRALLAVDMIMAIEDAGPGGQSRGMLVSLLLQALSVLAHDPPSEAAPGSLPSRSALALANELRALRGAALLSGNGVFAIAVDSQPTVEERAGDADSIDGDQRLASTARRLRSYYQQGLIAWLRDSGQPKAAAERIGDVFARLHAHAEGTAEETLWRAAASFAKLLEDPRWRVSVAVKRLLGQLDGRLKRLADESGPAPEAAPALTRDLLFYVGEGRDVDATMGVFESRSALLAAFAAPPRAHPDQPTAVLSMLNELLAISGQLMEALAPGESWPAKRAWLSERMLHVADGLGLLGAHALRRRTLEETVLLRATPRSGDPPAGGWGQMAERLHGLGADLLSAAGMEPAAAVAEDTAGMPSGGRIARRLEAELEHAEGVIRRLEQGRPSLAAEPPVASGVAQQSDDTTALRAGLDVMTGRARGSDEASPPANVVPIEAPSGASPLFATDHELLDDIAHIAGDIDGSRSRLEQQLGAFREGLEDMDAGIRALREELDGMRMHTEALRMPHDPADAGQVPSAVTRVPQAAEMRARLDRLTGGLGSIAALRDTIESIASDSRSLLVQQARDHVALEERLMVTRMQPLDVQLEALRDEIAERAADTGRQVLVRVDAGGLSIEPEKLAALLPVLRSLTASMVADSVEPPRARVLAGRPPGCLMEFAFRRRGADLDMRFGADCKPPPAPALAQAAAFLRPLGGRMQLADSSGRETRLSLQMPLSPRVTTVLLVAVGSEILALPLAEVTAVLQLPAEEPGRAGGADGGADGGEDGDSGLDAGPHRGAHATILHENRRWRLARLNALLALAEEEPAHPASRLPLVLVESEGQCHALVVDAIGDRVDVVVRSIAPQLRALDGLAGAAILGDGQVVLLLDIGRLTRSRGRAAAGDLESVG